MFEGKEGVAFIVEASITPRRCRKHFAQVNLLSADLALVLDHVTTSIDWKQGGLFRDTRQNSSQNSKNVQLCSKMFNILTADIQKSTVIYKEGLLVVGSGFLLLACICNTVDLAVTLINSKNVFRQNQ